MSQVKELHYFNRWVLHKDFDWYCRHFRDPDGGTRPVRGEISPAYTTLKRPVVEAIKRLMPDLRLFLVIRHPVERTWSQAMLEFGLMKQKQIQRVAVLKFIRHFERQRTRYRSDYLRAIKIWAGVFGRDRLKILLYDQMQADPRGYIAEILEHIRADSTWQPPAELVDTKVHHSQRMQVPAFIRWCLAKQWQPMVRDLNEYLEGQITHWVEDIDAIAAESRPMWPAGRWLNRWVTSVPERASYAVYDAIRDRRLARRCDTLVACHCGSQIPKS